MLLFKPSNYKTTVGGYGDGRVEIDDLQVWWLVQEKSATGIILMLDGGAGVLEMMF